MDDTDALPEVTSEARDLAAPPAVPEARPLIPKFSGSHETGHAVGASPATLQKVFRTDEPEQAKAYLQHCLAVLHPIEVGGGDFDDQRPFMISVVNDLGARDAVERMLAVQMAATYVALVRAGGWLANAKDLTRVEAYSTAYNKLARTYATQMEALRKHRNGGRQKVRVEHVHVHPGGQAIVGDVHHRGRGPRMKADDNPMRPFWRPGLEATGRAPRYSAHSKRTGLPCKAPAVTGWRVCRMHGAKGGHPAGPSHPRWTHEMRSRAWAETRKALNELIGEGREIARAVRAAVADQRH